MRKYFPALTVALLTVLLLFSSAMADVYTFWGKEISTNAMTVSFKSTEIGDASDLYQLLENCPKLKRIELTKAHYTYEERKALTQAFPNVNFYWEIRLNQSHVITTDITAYSTLGRRPMLSEKSARYFTLCKNLKALDIGHNIMRDLEWIRECKKLKILILADCGLTDITALEDLTEIEYLELFLNDITDISALANMKNLRDVNLAFNDIKDISPLFDLPNLERVWLMLNRNIPEEQIEKLRELHPDCQIVTYSYGATGNIMYRDKRQIPNSSWRHHPHYDTIYWIFNCAKAYMDWDEPVQVIYGPFQNISN